MRDVLFTRRALLEAGAALVSVPKACADEPAVPLWPGAPPGGGGPDGPPVVDAHGAASHVSRPTLTVVSPVTPSAAAVLVAAGGGYKRIENGREAMPAARWLAVRGITVYVLTYRLPAEGWTAGPLAPLQDAQRALRLIRAGAAGGPAATRLGVLGFSAGGHLMGMAATRSAFASYPPVDVIDRLSARPDATALIYPVITLESPYDRTSTRRSLVGPIPIRPRAPNGRSRPMCAPVARPCSWCRPRTTRSPIRPTPASWPRPAAAPVSRWSCTCSRAAATGSAWAGPARLPRHGRTGTRPGCVHKVS